MEYLLDDDILLDKSALCSDFDEDCYDIKAEGYCVKCWLHDPSKGLCKFLIEGS